VLVNEILCAGNVDDRHRHALSCMQGGRASSNEESYDAICNRSFRAPDDTQAVRGRGRHRPFGSAASALLDLSEASKSSLRFTHYAIVGIHLFSAIVQRNQRSSDGFDEEAILEETTNATTKRMR
jgi:hypothetical protein